jgi:hypothetical protein
MSTDIETRATYMYEMNVSKLEKKIGNLRTTSLSDTLRDGRRHTKLSLTYDLIGTFQISATSS